MKSEGWYLLLAIVFFIAIGFTLGFLIKGCSIPKPLPQISHRDTVFAPYPVITVKEVHYQGKPLIIHDTSQGIALFTAIDSLLIDTLGIKGKVAATVIYDTLKGIIWDWRQELQLPEQMTIIDSIYVNTVTEITKPYYSDIWFYSTIIEGIIIAVILVKSLWIMLAK